MARKKKHEEHENHERWLVSYADFITLLFAFFVVMYAISSLNEGKYRILADSLSSAFSTDPRTMSPVKVGDPGLSSEKRKVSESKRSGKTQSFIDESKKAEQTLAEMNKQIEASLKPLIDKGLISVDAEKGWIEIEISSSMLFKSSSATLTPESVSLLKIFGRILKRFPNDINVEGHTDNQKIQTSLFPSNWELSAARAASVVRTFEESGVESDRLVAIGHGSTMPVSSNDTEVGRKRNRRVVLVISKEPPRQSLNIQQPDNSIEMPDSGIDVPISKEGLIDKPVINRPIGNPSFAQPVAPASSPEMDKTETAPAPARRVFRERTEESE